MISSFKHLAAAMTRCVSIIEDYTRLSPQDLPASGGSLPTLANAISSNIPILDEEAATGKKAGKAKKEKKIKDPNAPKRPPSAYILFQNEIREDIRAANPGIAYKDVLNVVSERWKNLSESEKKVSHSRPVRLSLTLRQVYEGAYADAQNVFKEADSLYKAAGGVSRLSSQPAIGC
jgi:hypothetical protein